jgi:hypothetical protein
MTPGADRWLVRVLQPVSDSELQLESAAK